MRPIRIVVVALLFVTVGLAAIGAAAAVAAPSLVLKTSAGPLASGAQLTVVSSRLQFQTTSAVVECGELRLTGALSDNNQVGDKASIDAYQATGCGAREGGGGTFPARLEPHGLPWTVDFTPKGVDNITGTVAVTGVINGSYTFECTYESKKIASTFSIPGPVTLTSSGQVFKLVGGGGCPKEGTMNGTFTLTSGGRTVESELGSEGGEEAGGVSGVVTGGGAPAVNADARVCSVPGPEEEPQCQSVTTDADGRYAVAGLPEALYRVIVTPAAHSGYGRTESEIFAVVIGETASENVTLREAGTVTGTVRDTSGTPLPAVPVTVCSEEQGKGGCAATETGPEGVYTAHDLADGQYVATASPAPGSGDAKAHTDTFTVGGRETLTEDIVAPEAGSVHGLLSDQHGEPVAGATIVVCGEEECYESQTGFAGEYSMQDVADGENVVSVSPPAGYGGAEARSFTLVGRESHEENLTVNAPVPLPNDTAVSGIATTEVGGVVVPVLNWQSEAPISTKACVGGTVSATIKAENTLTGETETTSPVELHEAPAGSGSYTGLLPKVYPIHGEGRVTLAASGCAAPAEDEAVDFTVYIDPSGVVVDGNDSDAPLREVTVRLLSAETSFGPFHAVPAGSTVMSPANRTNPDTTDAAGEFAWDTTPGWYEVEASKPGCGRAVTPAFAVPPPAVNLTLVLHCLLSIGTRALSEATRGVPYEAQLVGGGEDPPFKWKKTAALPKGLKLSKTGMLSGTISAKKVAAGTYPIGVQVTDAKKHVTTATLELAVR